MAGAKPKIAILWRGDGQARQTVTPQNNRYHRVYEELALLGIEAEPAVYDEASAAIARLAAARVKKGASAWANVPPVQGDHGL